MKKFCQNLVFLFVILFSTGSLFGQNLPLILELTGPDAGVSLSKVEVRIVSQDGETDITLLTNELGQLVISSFAPGNYRYEINYGDYSTGTFSIAPGTPFYWIKADFRRATVALTGNDGLPIQDEDVTMYKILKNGTDSLLITRQTDENGLAEFILLDKENYKYTAMLQQGSFTMNGNIARSVSTISEHELVSIFFGFKLDGVIINVDAENIIVYKKNDAGNYVSYGMVPKKDAPNNAGYSIYDSHISSKPGEEYKAEVVTKLYGKQTKEYIVYATAEMNDTIYFLLETKEGPKPPDPPKPPFPEPGDTINVVKLAINAVWKDTGEPVPNAQYLINYNYLFVTDGRGIDTVYIRKDTTYSIGTVLGETPETYFITQDTTVILYFDDFYRVNFAFRLNGELIDPAPTDDIYIRAEGGSGMSILRCGNQLCPYFGVQGSYTYSFYLRQFNYNGQMRGDFEIPEIRKEVRGQDTTIYIDIEKKNEVKFIVLDLDGDPLPNYSAEIRQYKDGILQSSTYFDLLSHTGFVTDNYGSFIDYLLDGDYRIAILDTIFDFTIWSDTTIILQRKGADAQMKKVYFKFLLDGKEVFPQVMRIDLARPDNTNLFYITSSIQDDGEGGERRVFDKPARCFAGDYNYSFLLTDFGFNGKKIGSFEAFISEQQDTIIFVVLPIKPSVEITVLDKKRDPVVNVFGTIYKYNEDGTLNPDPIYDDFSHDMLKTDDGGIIWDRLLPGKYRFVMDGIVQRDFVVGEYDVKFRVISGEDYYTTTFIVKDTEGNPVANTLLEIKQEGEFYGSNLTDKNGEMKIENESGNYSYFLHYGTGKGSTYYIHESDTTIYIIVEKLIYAESIEIKGCPCVQLGESIQLFPEIAPEDATFKDVNWSVNNLVYANILSNGVLTANDAGLEGTVIVTATSKDGADISPATKEIQIKRSCNDYKIDLSIGSEGVKDTTISGKTLPLILGATNDKDDGSVDWLVYQYSTDKTTWQNMTAEPIQETILQLNAVDYNPGETIYFRVFAAESEEVVRKISEGDFSEDCVSYVVSVTVKCKFVDIFQSWETSVCSSDAEVTLNLSSETLPIIEQTGTTIEWYKKTETTGFVNMNIPEENWLNPTFTLTERTTFKVRIINASENFENEFEQTIDYVSIPNFNLSASENTVCEGTSVELSVNNVIPEGSFTWFNGSEQWTITVEADRTEYWAALKACPLDTAKISLTIDDSLKIKLTADKQLICSTGTTPIELNTEIVHGNAGTFSWSPNNSDNTATVSVLPSETTKYKVLVKTTLDKCPAAEDSVTIAVEQAIALTLSANETAICQDGTQNITLTANVQNGNPVEYLWWDGTKTSEPIRENVLPTETTTYSVQAKGTICPLSGVVSVEVKVDTPLEFSLTTDKTLMCETETTPVKLETKVTKGEVGTYGWSHSSENTASVSVLPSGTTKYKVIAKTALDKCPATENSVTIAVEQEIELLLSANKVIICQDGTKNITLTAGTLNGNPTEYIWWDGTKTSEPERKNILPTENTTYSVQAKNAVCPFSNIADVEVKIDTPLEFTLTADKTLICETEATPIKLQAKVTKGEGTYSWSHSSNKTASVSVLPNETTEYTVTIKTALDECPAEERSVTVEVESPVELTLFADHYEVCQNNTEYITLTADVENGTPTEYIWWDGVKTSEPTRSILPLETAIYSVQAKGTACPLSDVAFTDEVKVSIQTPVDILIKTSVVNFGEPTQLEAITDQAITGPYYWYMIEEGKETLLKETPEPIFEHFPSKATTYFVRAKNGTCPIVASLESGIRLVDATRIPTAFTPYDKDGLNDDFMPGYRVFIYDRYGNLICNSENGWDGTYRGKTADAGVYIYVVTMKDERVEKGTIEIIRLK